jgi:hypothetical protein
MSRRALVVLGRASGAVADHAARQPTADDLNAAAGCDRSAGIFLTVSCEVPSDAARPNLIATTSELLTLRSPLSGGSLSY